MDDRTKNEIQNQVEEAFSATVGENKRYVDITRFALICQTLVSIDRKLEDMVENSVTKEAFWPVKALVYGMVSLMLTGMMGAILYLVLKH